MIMMATTKAFVALLGWMLFGSVSATLVQQVFTCGNGQVGNGVCQDTSQCCSPDGYCTTHYCHVVGRHAAESIPSPSPDASLPISPVPTILATGNTSFAPTVSTVNQTNAPTISTHPTPAPSIATPFPTIDSTLYPTVVYSNCPNIPDVMTVNLAYYQSFAAFREPSCNQLLPGDIDVAGAGYTHLAYSFVGIDANYTLVPWDSNYATEEPLYREFNSLKRKHPNLKTMVSIGGWTFNNPGPTQTYFSDIASSPSLSASFAASVVAFLEKYNFDGVDIDWEFPGRTDRGGNASDYQNLPLLVKAIRDAYRAAGKDYILSLAIPPAKSALDIAYDLPALSENMDFFTILAYEIHGIWDVPKIVAAATYLPFIQKAVDYILDDVGIPSNQLVFGLSSFGHTYMLANASCTQPGCPFTDGGPGGCGGTLGTMPFFTIDEIIQSGSYDELRLLNSSATKSMVVNKTIYISFDDQETWSMRSAYALEKCMRGYFWWAVDLLPRAVPLIPRAGPKPIPPTPSPTSLPTTQAPSLTPTIPEPTAEPTTSAPSVSPSSLVPTFMPTTLAPSFVPTTLAPSFTPTTRSPSFAPTTLSPSFAPTTLSPSFAPTTLSPSFAPTTLSPSLTPTSLPSLSPTLPPSPKPSTIAPTSKPPTHVPSSKPTYVPTLTPTATTNIPSTIRPTRASPTGPVPAQELQAPASSAYQVLRHFITTSFLVVAVSMILV